MKKLFIFSVLYLFSCNGMGGDWVQPFRNNTDHEMCFYIHFDESGLRPSYSGLPADRPYMLTVQAYSKGGIVNDWRTKIRQGDLMHVYVFHPDTLAKYEWPEIVSRKKYWFQEVEAQNEIDFPGGFRYVGDE